MLPFNLTTVKIEKVMLVDDEPDIRMIGEVSLGDVGGWQVSLATSGQEALDKVASVKPDVILLDVMMPNMDGPTVLTQLKENADTGEIPVIFMTAKARESDIQHYMSLGAKGVITKPFDPMKLPEQVKSIIGQS